ncbi:RraA family protein [Allopusillimonas soli]|uniref:Putative 4-hydroxy-4-methyl-2-oxoglutarate aldolase n=1 Tax=Allopusillimonas soli TaxID=659016 RepID=A0A853FBU7_9BURK|nr:RraA family protein [Allopusillimonas soli]NYT36021.1 RraA family protein [Allopusillimonas soli]TEA76364.1 RraA family protein [Allopusillimonas soli]
MSIHTGTRPPVSAALIARFNGLETSTIGNVLDDLGLGGIILNIKPVGTGMSFAGAALTVKEVTGAQHTYRPEEFGLGAVVDGIQPLDVVVIDNGGQQVSTWGGVASEAAARNGAAGLLVDGGIRDVDEIMALGFAAFSRHVVPLSAKTRVKVIEINTVVKIDGVAIAPGDIIVGDSTGVVRVPLARAEEVAARAWELAEQDSQAIKEIRAGLSFTKALKKFSKL